MISNTGYICLGDNLAKVSKQKFPSGGLLEKYRVCNLHGHV
jgi:hypothetical protein